MRLRGLALTTAAFAFLLAPAVSQAQMIHRYSFNGDTSDSIGGEDGILVGGATVTSSQLVLNGVDAACRLPIGDTLSVVTNCTIEGWATWGSNTGQFWSRIFDFGNDTLENMFLTPQNGANGKVRFAITIGGAGGEEQTTSNVLFPVNIETHFAVTIDADNGIDTLYINGMPVVILFDTTLNPSMMTAPTTSNYLGKSQYPDPFFLGSINEFRIYANALAPGDVLASFQAGPDA